MQVPFANESPNMKSFCFEAFANANRQVLCEPRHSTGAVTLQVQETHQLQISLDSERE